MTLELRTVIFLLIVDFRQTPMQVENFLPQELQSVEQTLVLFVETHRKVSNSM
jgi:hypothetical protein